MHSEQQYFEKHNISLSNITAVTTDGVPAMVGTEDLQVCSRKKCLV